MASIKSEIDYINEAKTNLRNALISKFGIPEASFYNDTAKTDPKRLHDWVVLVNNAAVVTSNSLKFYNGNTQALEFNGSSAKDVKFFGSGGIVVTNSNGSFTFKGSGIRAMGLTPSGHTLNTGGGTFDTFYQSLLDNEEIGAWVITYSNGTVTTLGSDNAGRIQLSDGWKSRLNYSGATHANVGDLLVCYKLSALISVFKILTLNEAGESRVGLMSPNDKIQVNKIPGLESAIASKLSITTSDVNIGNAGSGLYTSVTSGRTNWVDTSTAGAAVKLGSLQIAVDNSGRLYSRNQTKNTWNLTNQLMTVSESDVDKIVYPAVFGYGRITNGPTSNNYTVYTISSSDYDANGYRSNLLIAINRDNSTPYLRTTFLRVDGRDSSFIKTNWVGIPLTLDLLPDGDSRKILTLGTTSTTAAAGNHTHSLYLPTTGGNISGNLLVNNNKVLDEGQVVNTITGDTSLTSIPNVNALRNALTASFAANDAMIYKGTYTGTASPLSSVELNNFSSKPGNIALGWTWKVRSAGYFGVSKVEVGDMIISCAESPGSSEANYNIILNNIDVNMFKITLTDL